MKPIRLSRHAAGYIEKRGFTLSEVEDAIRTTPWEPSELGRLECKKNFAYNNVWNGKEYDTKQVRPIFVEDVGEIVVVTVYTYYF
ncbi:DUF4258 domain-containing protein [Sphingobacteriales bacterium CHB3]|nr:DUF4258 domain-containing protein [Sphingobacteriales bacterium CHB3]